MNNKFTIAGTNEVIWNMIDLVGYLSKNQHKHISLVINPEAISLEALRIYELLEHFSFKQVDIYTQNCLEKHNKYNIIQYGCPSLFLKQKWIIDTQYHTWNQKKVFLAFYHRPTANRLGLASHLYSFYPATSLVHFSSFVNSTETIYHFELDKLLSYDIQSVKNATNMIPNMPIWSNGKEDLTLVKKFIRDENVDTILKTIYQDILIDVVSESHLLGNTFYITEKTARPMWLKKPFIVFASRDYLDYLHQMGFKTFNDFWSEDYDGYEGRDRYIRILTLIDELANKSKKELQEMYQAMQPILDHNYNLLQTQSYNTTITKIT
jgi:hypothetical protein